MSRTLTGRRQAEHVAQITGATSTWAWVAEASGRERTRRATVRRIAKLTGTEPVRWDGEISDAHWTAVLSAGADALLAHATAEEAAFGLDLVAAAEAINAEAAAATDTELERTTVLPTGPSPVPGRHVAQAAANPDRTTWEQAEVETWSPWRNGPRWSETRRALSGPRPVRD
ncbi:hypothetical protein GCM10010495_74330 [Kitasatospora herbaricolor]|uniref:hypothetical protein n=1 Tax=Kitasatospora herbaricolor TaxID=68217 RepID=UPI00174A2F07|nr:hypothetical protein [Kitasatospora herbaricolor]MDQ0305485.1 hypothetical protein [Kitasatospora herbaricolor]GGV45828.1 hypothetical protein GCM10010495_74330 [Kitasatospora herbaricolor]